MPGSLKVICNVGKQQLRSSPLRSSRRWLRRGSDSAAQPGRAEHEPAAGATAPPALPKAGWPQALLTCHFEQRFILSVRTGHISAMTRATPSLPLPRLSVAIRTSKCHSALERGVLWCWIMQFHEHSQNWHCPLSPCACHFHR